MEDSYGGGIDQIHMIKNGHVEVFVNGEILPTDGYRIFAIYMKNGEIIK